MSEINIGQFAEALNTKADTDLRNIDTNKCDMVIEYKSPDSNNSYKWYRLYASGWVEQGGIIPNLGSDADQVITFPITMIDTNYTLIGGLHNKNDGAAWHSHVSVGWDKTTTGFTTSIDSIANSQGKSWYCCGIADMTGHEILPNPSQNLILEMIKSIYPVGSLYMGTQATCPMATIIPNSTWELVSSGKALWTGDGSNANTTIEAGLPNITGTTYAMSDRNSQPSDSGAFTSVQTAVSAGYEGGHNNGDQRVSTFDASRSSSIYGKSSTVQPPAYVVNVWRRTA